MASTNVRVTKILGGGGAIGEMLPRPNMVTNQGTIVGLDSGNYLVSVSGANVRTLTKYYPDQLWVNYSHATGVWSWPTGDGSVVYGHSGVFPNGVPLGMRSGLYFEDQAGVHVFSRP